MTGTSQEHVLRIERVEDTQPSTIRRYVEALGVVSLPSGTASNRACL
jgi:hypothetical protein